MTPHAIAHADQLTAACRDALTALHAIAEDGRGYLAERPAAVPWLAAQASVFVRALTVGTVELCPHLGSSPQVVHAAAWAPGRLVCTGCVAALRPGPDEDATCDRCRCRPRRLYPGAAAFGPVLLAYGLCPSCLRVTGLAPARGRTRAGRR
ncbi:MULTISPECIES: hypothetical protein [Protofrankia]|uniref:Uncharacterized protein n=1 Tax=Candidatus Protofrankia datiscae TaxID=2716812 RepID=F8AX95_9ACTN|nr:MULTISPECIES: hypothetical protein [Protofrankia]AEH08446.1 hypothetical protein FsymDg_0940 [Candidatus Protofrankia datiscae]